MLEVSKKGRFRGQNRWNVDTSIPNSSNLSYQLVFTPVLEIASVRKVRSQSYKISEYFDGAHSYRLSCPFYSVRFSLYIIANLEELKVSEDEAVDMGIADHSEQLCGNRKRNAVATSLVYSFPHFSSYPMNEHLLPRHLMLSFFLVR